MLKIPLFLAFFIAFSESLWGEIIEMLPNDSYFNPVAIELMRIPSSSQVALDKASRGEPIVVLKAAEFPIISARSYAVEFLTEAYKPPEGLPFLAFPSESGLCDVIRANYEVNSVQIWIAQSRYLFSIIIKGFDFGDRMNEVKRMELLVNKVLKASIPIELISVGTFGKGLYYGLRKIPSTGPLDPNWPHWLDELRWWYNDAQKIGGIITLKATGGPTKAEIGPDEELNCKWF